MMNRPEIECTGKGKSLLSSLYQREEKNSPFIEGG
jgi:hypothetical protein